ncbi:MAG: SGNH/GDSL hydrolase family protein [Puniceicoccales bacterium]
MRNAHQKMRLALMVGACLATSIVTAETQVKSGETIAFLGDSITEQGARSSSGYVNLVEAGLKANGIEVTVIPAGRSGHKSNQMLERLERSVLEKNPQWMTLSCGVNDVWHRERGVSLEDYKTNITEIVDRCDAADVNVIILTATPIRESDNELNQKLAGYNEFLRELAKSRGLPLADTSAAFWEVIEANAETSYSNNYLTSDGVHMNPLGDLVMATEVLEAFGLDDAQMATAREGMMRKSARINAGTNVSLEDYLTLVTIAKEREESVGKLLNLTLKDGVRTELDAAGSAQ